MDRRATVFIVDDDPAVRQGLSLLVRSMQLLPETYASGQEFLNACDPSRRGCLLLDVRMPGISGLELLDRLVERGPHPPVILISAYGDVPTVVRAMKAGAVSFLEKPCRDQQLWEAIQDALECDARNRRQAALRAALDQRLARLSDGERDVLEMLVEGESNKVIAARLGLSIRTIEVRRAKIMRKMKAETLADLIRLALSARLPCAKPHAGFGNYH
ncbi:MAG: response regulator transcription factor [Pirellulales bacterium]|nr:response regulator transcription factor [Pirellulales bacterium]